MSTPTTLENKLKEQISHVFADVIITAVAIFNIIYQPG